MTVVTSELDLLRIGDDLLASPAAQRALRAGQLEAKRAALAGAARLARAGWPLLIAIMAVSFVHAWDVIALIKPDFVGELKLPQGLYHLTAAAQTIAIDAAALYCVAAAAAAATAGAGRGRQLGVAFFLGLTLLLNMAYVVRYAPALRAEIRAEVLPVLDVLFAVGLPSFIPIAIVAVEQARARLELARLRLMIETTALAELLKDPAPAPAPAAPPALPESPVKALESVSGPVRSPGRPALDLVELLTALPAESTTTRAGVQQLLDCSATTADRLIAEAVDVGRLERIARGQYRRR